MGWLSWERFKCQINCHHYDDTNHNNNNKLAGCISENLFTQIADTLVERGYQRAGYDRINIDDCWSKKSRELDDGHLLPDPDRFPNGIKYLADYMHERGLKLGMYQNYGHRTCMGYPGILGHLEQDVQTFADWDVDMIKLDACFSPKTSQLDSGYMKFRKIVDKTKRPMIISCSWPYYQVFASKVHIIPKWDLISMNCNLFRVFHDITSNWKVIQKIIDFMGDNQQIFRAITGPGSWPDPDMLMIGNVGLSVAQAESQMAIWCILPAPLFMSNDPRVMEPEFEKILLNSDAISINQDVNGEPGERFFHNTTMDLWRRSLSENQMALVILNRDFNQDLQISIPLEQIESNAFQHYQHVQVLNIFSNEKYQIRRQRMADNRTETYIKVIVEPTGCVFLKLTPLKN
ncbi:hypothetical protein HUG17_2249 [Dermatophagoides farinae]|uniref:Alpha-galactosidase n=1 Tax=Dermatophagoides farinae TaxID=6954 RepID=A0A9D4PAA9_DERFA|nr:hypothetical protein HUG17_2249 [Dermatophagoides farinae]